MNCKLYENQALQFYNNEHRHADSLYKGLVEEANEVYDALSDEEVIDELGDVLWYVTILANSLGTTIDEVMMRNINKLEMRELRGKKNA